MAAFIIKSDVVQHYSGEVDNNGGTVVVGFEIGGIVPGSDPFGQALQAPGLPVRGSTRTGLTGIIAQKYTYKPFLNSRTKCWILVTYRPPEFFAIGTATAEWKATTHTASRSYDGDGRQLRFEFKDPQSGNILPEMIAKCTDTLACSIFVGDWTTFENPTAALAPYVNTINETAFRGTSRYTWWFSDLWIRKARYQSEYNVHVEIEYDPESWMQTFYYRDHKGEIWKGINPADARETGPGIYKDKGFARGTLKRGADFTALPDLIPGFNDVVPDLSDTQFITLSVPSTEDPRYGVF